MVKVKEGLRGKNPEEKVTYGNKVVAKMTSNPNFPDDATVVAALLATTKQLDLEIKSPTSTATTIKEKEKEFNIKMKAAVAHVQVVVNEVDKDKALVMVESAGMEAAKKGSINIPELSAKQGKAANSVEVRKKREKGTLVYVFQMCTDPSMETNWKIVKTSTRAKVIVTGLSSGNRYFFRVAIIRGDVQEDYSDSISIVVD